MTTSDASWPGKLRLVGELERPDHWHLTEADNCAFMGEYSARKGYAHSFTNGLVSNLKKKPSTRGTPQWRYKLQAIERVANALASNIEAGALSASTFVPIPPSKPPGHPEYDDRMAQVARAMGVGDLREILFTKSEREALHATSNHRDMNTLRASIGVREELKAPTPTLVVLLDDMLTTGCSFRVCCSLLREIWPNAAFFGLFVARRVIDHSVVFEDVS